MLSGHMFDDNHFNCNGGYYAVKEECSDPSKGKITYLRL